MPIFLAPLNTEVTITHIHGEGKVVKHLKDLGLTAGAKVRVLANDKGALILFVLGSKLAIDKDSARAILVS
ncbi:MAG: ferrous iron transport protein A [Bacilli bacterium]|nr:ferrous iron transport protein A [Bacilli bacterium]